MLKRILSIVLMMLTFWSFQIGVTHRHTHILHDGTLVEHAHPLGKSTSSDGSSQPHSFKDFCCLCNFLIDELPAIHSQSSLLAVSDFFYPEVKPHLVISPLQGTTKGRAPPFHTTDNA